jgi:tetratricopeptide (TPR) repeat protein
LDKANSKADIDQSIADFEEAIRRDPEFAPGYVGLAEAYWEMSTILIGAPPEQARSQVVNAAEKALQIDPDSADAHVVLGKMRRVQWQWADSEAEFKRALDLNPNNSAGYLGFSTWLLSQGRTDEALAWAQRGRQLDPLSDAGPEIGWLLFCAHRYDESTRELRSTLAVRPDDAGALWTLGYVLNANQQAKDAIPVLEKALSISDRSPGVIGVLIRAYAHAGRRADALQLLAELKKRKQTGYVPTAAFVNAYLGLGEYDEAFVWLEQAYKEHSPILLFIKTHPYFDPIRDDPRFKDLLRRVGLG